MRCGTVALTDTESPVRGVFDATAAVDSAPKKISACAFALVIYLGYCRYYKLHVAQQHAARLLQLKNFPRLLSGVYVEEREVGLPFPVFKQLINSRLPYHVSLKIPHEDGAQRHVGLGPVAQDTLFTGFLRSLMTHWRLHEGPAYQHVKRGNITPVEAWPLFYRYYGYFPDAVDAKKLRDLTLTPGEGGRFQGYFFSFMRMPRSWWPRFVNCQTKALAAVHDAMNKPSR